ncbi:signal peptidase II [Sutterella sp.]|uniref:signal peptidase II n=1 Tax=Sutterella sp. TaxID=1981025 RepID=UPI0026E08833|nr:signal peptidase II [Sutterella sp.]MDO5532079.1 signal peptidase II [Sutterella sp.]
MAEGQRRRSAASRPAGSTGRSAGGSGASSSPKPSRPSGPTTGKFALWTFLGFLVFVLDQVTKFWFERHLDPGDIHPVFPCFNLTLAHNYGAAFSFLAEMGGWQRWVLSAFALVVVVVVLRLLKRHSDRKLFSLALTLIAAGAIGNLADRVTSGYVIDFLDFYWRNWHWPAFNVADVAICTGAAGIVLDELLGLRKDR